MDNADTHDIREIGANNNALRAAGIIATVVSQYLPGVSQRNGSQVICALEIIGALKQAGFSIIRR